MPPKNRPVSFLASSGPGSKTGSPVFVRAESGSLSSSGCKQNTNASGRKKNARPGGCDPQSPGCVLSALCKGVCSPGGSGSSLCSPGHSGQQVPSHQSSPCQRPVGPHPGLGCRSLPNSNVPSQGLSPAPHLLSFPRGRAGLPQHTGKVPPLPLPSPAAGHTAGAGRQAPFLQRGYQVALGWLWWLRGRGWQPWG